MKFMKGMLIGTMVSAGIAMMYSDSANKTKRMMMKKGKKDGNNVSSWQI